MLRHRGAVACMLSLVLLSVPVGTGVSAASNLLQKGMSGEQVVQLQKDLKRLGYFDEECTGYYGDVTKQAVMNLQGSQGYIKDGIAGSQTLSLIESLLKERTSYDGILQEGSSGDHVANLQEDLSELGYFSGDVTGYFGSITKNAVIAFQKAYNLYCDGVVGSKTISVIKQALQNDKSYSNVLLKKGMSGSEVKTLQNNLTAIGVYSGTCTGYFGPYTEQVVKDLQYKYGKECDGIVGEGTYALIQDILAGKAVAVNNTAISASSSSPSNNTFKIPWSQAQEIFSIGTVATVLDIETGKSFKVKRTFGYNHADTETLTAEDTAIMRSIFGGWNWDRRAIILKVGDTYIAASMAGMPHAGRDDKPSAVKVYNRSGDYGYGDNLDAVKGNNMDGVFDVHFYMSKTHSTNRVDSRHQEMIDVANEYAKKKY